MKRVFGLISERSDAQLVREVLDGEHEAFNVLVRRWERKVYSYLAYLTGHSEDAWDLCQEAFVSAYRHLGKLREPERFTPWLFQIAHNTAYSHLRGRLEPEASLGPAHPAENSEVRYGDGPALDARELKLLLEKALGALPMEQREAVVLKFYQGFKFAEIAEIQNCPLSTVKTRVYASLERLKEILQA